MLDFEYAWPTKLAVLRTVAAYPAAMSCLSTSNCSYSRKVQALTASVAVPEFGLRQLMWRL